MCDSRAVGPGFHGRVYEVVASVPRGRVASYGDIAAVLGARSVARHVGHALAALPAHRTDVPWHRIVNAKGRVSYRSDGARSVDQIARLIAEGVAVDANGTVTGFAEVRWTGPSAPAFPVPPGRRHHDRDCRRLLLRRPDRPPDPGPPPSSTTATSSGTTSASATATAS